MAKQAGVLRFHAEVAEYPEESWRDILILPSDTLEDLGDAVLRAFGCHFGHLWNITYKRTAYEGIDIGADAFWGPERPPANSVVLADLNLRVRSVFHLSYDYGTTWKFNIRLAAKEELQGDETDYPQLVAGKGPDMVEDLPPYEVWDLGEIQRAGGNIEDENPDLAAWIGEDWKFDTDPEVPRPL